MDNSTRDSSAPSSVKRGADPTETVLSESGLDEKWICDYVINTAVGCAHGCRFCYVPSTPAIRTRPGMLEEQAGVDSPQEEWGEYVLHRDPERTANKLDGTLSRKRTWKVTERGRGIVALSFSTDCYQDEATAETTGACIRVLLDHDIPVRIQTRSPLRAAKHHRDLIAEGADRGLVTVGTSIPSLDADEVAAIEPRAPAPEARLRGLEAFADAGVPTFVSMSPTYPTDGTADLHTMLETFDSRLDTLDVVFHEALNPRGCNFQMTVLAAQQAGEHHLAARLGHLRDRDRWRSYATTHLLTVVDLADRIGIPLKSWPGNDIVSVCDDPLASRLTDLKAAPTPEDFPVSGPPHHIERS